MPKAWLVLWINLAVALSASSAHSAWTEAPSSDDAALVKAADAVIVAEVIESQTQPGPRDIERHVVLRVLDSIKGSVREGEVVTLVEPGGRLGNLAEIIPGAAHYEPGQTVLVCLSLDRSGHWRTLGMNQGRFLRESAGERTGWTRDGDVQTPGGLPGKWRSESAFKSYAGSVARGDIAPPDYWEERPLKVETASAATSSHPPAAYLSYVAGSTDPVRWNITGTPLRWFSNGTHSGSAGGGMNALTKALAAWTDDPRSDVVLEYAGFTPELRGICGGCEDGINTIHLGDPNDELPFSADSMTKIWVDVAAKHTFKGDIFATIRSADIVVANVRYEEKELEELLTREFGVALGFRDANVPGRSPSSDTAIMTLTDGEYGRYGAVLQGWDKEALLSVYPAAGFVADPLQPTLSEALIGGDGASFRFTVTGTYGSTAPITFRLKDPLPAGLSVTFSPDSAPAAGATPITVSIRAETGAIPGDVPLTVVATSGSFSRNTGPVTVTFFDLEAKGTTATLYPNESREVGVVPVWRPRIPTTIRLSASLEPIVATGVSAEISAPNAWASVKLKWVTTNAKPTTVQGSLRLSGAGRTLIVPMILRVTDVTVIAVEPVQMMEPNGAVEFTLNPIFANGSEGEWIVVTAGTLPCGLFGPPLGDHRIRISSDARVSPGVYRIPLVAVVKSPDPRRNVVGSIIVRDVDVAVVVESKATPRYRVYGGPGWTYHQDAGDPRDLNGKRMVVTKRGVWTPTDGSPTTYFRGAWRSTGTFKEVPHDDLALSQAYFNAIDEQGRIAGMHDDRAIVTSSTKALQGIYEYVGDHSKAVFYALSEGRAAGQGHFSRPVYAGRITPGTSLTDLTESKGTALGINKYGHVVGWYMPDGKTTRPFLYKDGKLSPIGTGGGKAVDINDSGAILVVGEDGRSSIFKNGSVRLLPLSSPAVDMNESETAIAGASVVENGTLLNLNALIAGPRDFYLTEAVAINEKGDIAARAQVWARPLVGGDCGWGHFAVLLVRDDNPATRACSYTVQRSGSQVTVTTGPTCKWAATYISDWIAVSRGSGEGTQIISVELRANPLPVERKGVLIIEDQVLEFVQPAGSAVCEAPVIASQPQPAALKLGETGLLAVEVVSTPPASFAWMVLSPGASAAQPVPNGSAASLTVNPDRVGTWVYWVRIANDCGSVDSAQVKVEVREPAPACKAPVAGALEISYSGATSRCSSGNGAACLPGEVIQFTASVWGSGIQACDTLAWEFGDGTTATGRTVTRTFTSPGAYDVRLTLANPQGRTSVSGTVTVRQSGVVPTNLAISVEGSLAPNAPLRFSGTATGEVSSWQWNFGGGSTASGQSVTHMFPSAGTYQVQLTASNAAGTAQTTKQVVIASVNTCPSMVPGMNVFIWFTAAQSGCTAGVGECLASEPLAFLVGSFGYNFACGTHAFEWNFGDGTPSSSAMAPTHAYSTPGSYTVTVKVTNGSQTVHLSHLVTVKSGADGSTNRRRSTRR